ncbi:tRNA-dihydrouridine synthase [Rhodococcus sp. 3A]|nr:NADH:flavin oxidoreductase [Rhodococcus sp. 3A]MBC2640741.1 NADH:flavin oxidoreductase [Rhodococcus sp. 3A]MBC2894514.1 NADH:flavin oxidoreductase [Rhodococcus sp. 4CII]
MTSPQAGSHSALRPARIGTLGLKNSLVVAPMTRVSADADGTPTTEMADYYGEFAVGGFGLIITEGTYTDARHSQGYRNQPGLVSDRHVHGWRQVVHRVHEVGVPIIVQLMHAGALSQGNYYGAESIAPSALAPRGEMMPEYGGNGRWPIPRAMEYDDITQVTSGFVSAARNAVDAGFDGVEIHAANGYLLDQFLTDYTNHRTDSFGGDVSGRMRLTEQIASEIRRAVGHRVTVGVRLSQTKINDFTYRWPGGVSDAETIFAAVSAAGVDYLHIASEGRNFVETARMTDGRTITQIAREASGLLPVIANGGMHDLGQTASVLDGGHADLVSLGRGALANPDLPCRLAQGAKMTDLNRFDHSMLEPFATLGNARRWAAGGSGSDGPVRVAADTRE